MIKFVSGNILTSNAQTLVNPVNCVGVMGRGLAREFRIHFPEMYADYVDKCLRNKVRPGFPYIYYGNPNIVNFPTKLDWRDSSRLEWVEEGLKYLVAHYIDWGIRSIAVPALGCGNGGLKWEEVRPVMVTHLGRMPIPVYIFIPKEK